MPDQNEGFQERINARIKEITDRYQPQIRALEAKGQQLAADFSNPDNIEAIIDVDFTIDWKDVDIIFDLPSVTMRTQEISLDHDIIISVPEPFMQEQRIVLGLPSVTMRRQDWKIDIPEFKMEQQHWKIGLPQFTAKKISVETQRMTQEGKQLQAEGEALGARMKAEIEAVIGFGKASAQQATTKAGNDILQSFDSAIAALSQSVKDLEAKGIDPIKVPGTTGDINLRKQLADLIDQRTAAVQATGMAPPAPLDEPAQAAA